MFNCSKETTSKKFKIIPFQNSEVFLFLYAPDHLVLKHRTVRCIISLSPKFVLVRAL